MRFPSPSFAFSSFRAFAVRMPSRNTTWSLLKDSHLLIEQGCDHHTGWMPYGAFAGPTQRKLDVPSLRAPWHQTSPREWPATSRPAATAPPMVAESTLATGWVIRQTVRSYRGCCRGGPIQQQRRSASAPPSLLPLTPSARRSRRIAGLYRRFRVRVYRALTRIRFRLSPRCLDLLVGIAVEADRADL